MDSKIVLLLFACVAAACAVGQFYVPRAYFTIDGTGHESAHVPLRRLRRSAASTGSNIAHAINNAQGSVYDSLHAPSRRLRRSAAGAVTSGRGITFRADTNARSSLFPYVKTSP